MKNDHCESWQSMIRNKEWDMGTYDRGYQQSTNEQSTMVQSRVRLYNIQDLPAEICQGIVRHVDRQDLYALRLASRWGNAHGKKCLFQAIILKNSLASTQKVESILRRADLATLVEVIDYKGIEVGYLFAALTGVYCGRITVRDFDRHCHHFKITLAKASKIYLDYLDCLYNIVHALPNIKAIRYSCEYGSGNLEMGTTLDGAA